MQRTQKSNKKSLNRNPFNEKLIHRFYIESLYFGEFVSDRANLVPKNMHKNIKYSKVALIIPEDRRARNYRPDFSIYFKSHQKPVPVEIKWKTSDFSKENQIQFLKKNGGYLVVFDHDQECDLPVVKLDVQEFQNWLANRIYKLSHDTLTSKNIAVNETGKWIVTIRGREGLENFRKVVSLKKPRFWAFKNSKYVTNQIFNLQKNDEMIFLFIKSPEDGISMSPNKPTRKIEILAWAKVKIEDPYYICLTGPKTQFFEEIRAIGKKLQIPDRKWVHFIDFEVKTFQDRIFLERNRGNLDQFLVSSSNQGGALTEISSSLYKGLISYLETQTSKIRRKT